MKKLFFSFLALIIVSLFSVSIVSCGSDDDNTVSTSKSSYKFEYTLSDDFLQLFDVKTVITVGTTTTELKYDKDVTKNTLLAKYSCKTTGMQTFEVEQGTTVSSKTTCTLKSNWKEIIASKEDISLYSYYYISTPAKASYLEHSNVLDGTIQTEGFDKILNEWAENLTKFDYSNK